MKNKFLLLVLLTIHYSLFTNAQEQATMNLALRQYINQNPNSAEKLQLLVQGNVCEVESAVKNLGGTFKYSVQTISAVSLSVNKIFLLAQTPGVKRIEGRHGTGTTLDDQTDIHANITPVKQGMAPLPQAYDGTDVIVGVIDSEIDVTHPDFYDAAGNTRIKYLWSQLDVAGGTTPAPYNYGQEWDSAAIASGISYVPTAAWFGHGSIVTGCAVGDPDSVEFQGVAPKSDIIFVAVDLGSNFLNAMVDAVDYIYAKAALLGKPCVINASVGTYGGSHDALDLPATAIDNIISQDSGRSLVAAAGNAGNIMLHLQYDAEPDSAFTWFKYYSTISCLYWEVWAYESQFNNLQFALGADLTSPYTYLGRTNYYNILSDFTFTAGYAQLIDTLREWNGTIIGYVTIEAEIIDTTYHLAITINTTNTAYNYRFITKGEGQFDVWSHPSYTGTSNMLKANLPTAAVYPEMARYRLPTTSQTICSSFQCSDKVITVANFVNRNDWIDFTGVAHTDTFITGARFPSSSIGSTRDGRMKPDISAPGEKTYGAGLLSLMPSFMASNPQKVSTDTLHIYDGGTSMAAPVVAGVIALYMQRYPNLDWLEIKNAVIASAITDTFTTTNVPNALWGFGKIDAFKLLDTLINSPSCQTTSSSFSEQICAGEVIDFNGASLNASGIYFDTLMNAGGCDSIVTLTLAVDTVTATLTGNGVSLSADQSGTGITYQWYNCDLSVNVSGATNENFTPTSGGNFSVLITDSLGCSQMSACMYADGVGINEVSNWAWNIFPNPVSDELTVQLLLPNEPNLVFSITDVAGKKIYQSNINQKSEILNLKWLSKGSYFFELRNGKTILAVQKIVKL